MADIKSASSVSCGQARPRRWRSIMGMIGGLLMATAIQGFAQPPSPPVGGANTPSVFGTPSPAVPSPAPGSVFGSGSSEIPDSLLASDQQVARSRTVRQNRSRARMRRLPQMFGDFYQNSGSVTYELSRFVVFPDNVNQNIQQVINTVVQIPDPNASASFLQVNVSVPVVVTVQQTQLFGVEVGVETGLDLAIAGGTNRLSIAENNSAFPVDRVFVMGHHFENAFEYGEFRLPPSFVDDEEDIFITGGTTQHSIRRGTVGFEKTFLDGDVSVEFRLPATLDGGQFRLPDVSASGSQFGNLAVVFKGLLWADEQWAVAAGFGATLPTGNDVAGTLGEIGFTVGNDAIHLQPFLGCGFNPTDRVFLQAFAQLDLPTRGNRVEIRDDVGATQFGRWNPQSLIRMDAAAGYWLYQNQASRFVTGLAGVCELHVTNTLERPDVVEAEGQGTMDFAHLSVGNADGETTNINLTTGVHTIVFGGATARMGVVLPLRNTDERPFDAEVQLSINVPF